MSIATWTVGDYTITSYGNGTYYNVNEDSTGRDFFLQGDDALQWRDDYNAADEMDSLVPFLARSMRDYN